MGCDAQIKAVIADVRQKGFSPDAILWSTLGAITNIYRGSNPFRRRAENALRCYVEAKGELYERSSGEAAALIADLLHLVAAIDQGDDPIASTLRLAQLHLEAEHNNPEEEAE